MTETLAELEKDMTDYFEQAAHDFERDDLERLAEMADRIVHYSRPHDNPANRTAFAQLAISAREIMWMQDGEDYVLKGRNSGESFYRTRFGWSNDPTDALAMSKEEALDAMERQRARNGCCDRNSQIVFLVPLRRSKVLPD